MNQHPPRPVKSLRRNPKRARSGNHTWASPRRYCCGRVNSNLSAVVPSTGTPISDGTFNKRPFLLRSSSYARPTVNAGSSRQQPRNPQSNLLPSLAHHAAHSVDTHHQTSPANSEDVDTCVHGMWSWSGTFAMGESTGTFAGEDWAHEGRRRSILAARNLGEQSKAGAGQRDR